MQKIMLLLFLNLFLTISYAQEFNPTQLDSLFDLLEAENQFMGSLALSRNGQELYSKAIGYADIASKKKATVNTKYRIGSITKMFTSVLILKAVEEGKISLDNHLSDYFTEIENADDITITNLLNHSSGIFNFTNAPDYLKWNTVAKTREELLQILKNSDAVFFPNDKTDYSNTNYVLLTFILEDLYDSTYARLVENKITVPLGLRATYVGSTIDLTDAECNSYTFKGIWIKENETDMSVPRGAGNMVSKPSDLNIFIEALFNGKLISPKSLEQMTTINDGVGLGIIQFPFNDRKGLGHGGGIDGFSSFLGYLPADKIAVAITSNGTVFENNEILKSAISAGLGETFKLPSFNEIVLTSAELDTYLGIYASERIPLKITVTKDEKNLIAQATGQSSFPLSCTKKDVFKFTPAGVVMEFVPEEDQLTLRQGGAVIVFKRE